MKKCLKAALKVVMSQQNKHMKLITSRHTSLTRRPLAPRASRFAGGARSHRCPCRLPREAQKGPSILYPSPEKTVKSCYRYYKSILLKRQKHQSHSMCRHVSNFVTPSGGRKISLSTRAFSRRRTLASSPLHLACSSQRA